MTSDHVDDPREPKPTMIPGVHRYCDSWCERCRFQPRCRLFQNRQQLDAAIASGKSIKEALQLQFDASDEDPRPWLKASERLERKSFLKFLNEAFNHRPSSEELRAVEDWERRREDARRNDPLSVASGEYADLCRELLGALRRQVDQRGDAIVTAAIETLERFAFTIAVKTWRAVVGTVSLGDGDDDELREISRADCNGTAKLVRLLIAESREAWHVLMYAGCGDGVPVRMIERLESLDAGVAKAFPDAMAFVRPGLDEPDVNGS